MSLAYPRATVYRTCSFGPVLVYEPRGGPLAYRKKFDPYGYAQDRHTFDPMATVEYGDLEDPIYTRSFWLPDSILEEDEDADEETIDDPKSAQEPTVIQSKPRRTLLSFLSNLIAKISRPKAA